MSKGQEIYNKLVSTKEKYAPDLLAIDGIHAVGVRVLEQKVIVYCHDVDPSMLAAIPFELEDMFQIEIMGHPEPDLKVFNYTDLTGYAATTPAIGNDIWVQGNFRPVISGVSVGNYLCTRGTLGLWVYSEKFKGPLLVSNNHVIAGQSQDDQPQARIRQKTNQLTINVGAGGTPTNVAQLNDLPPVINTFVSDWNKPTLISTDKVNVIAGELLTITGKSLGFRKGYSKVFVGGQEAIVKSWTSVSNKGFDVNIYHTLPLERVSTDTDSTIIVYVPDGIVGNNVIVEVEVEGDPILQRAQLDGGRLKDQIAELVDYDPLLYVSEDRNTADVAFAKPVIPMNQIFPAYRIEASAPPDFSSGDPYVNKEYSRAGRKTNKVRGVQNWVCEKLPITKTGATSGTTYGLIYDPSYTAVVGYGRINLETGEERIIGFYQGDTFTIYNNYNNTWFEAPDGSGQYNAPSPFLVPGDSGSACYTASLADYQYYVNEYQMYHYNWTLNPTADPAKQFVLTQTDLNAIEQMFGPVTPDNFVGNLFYGAGAWMPWDIDGFKQTWSSGSDKAINWMQKFNVMPLGADGLTDLGNIVMNIISTSSINASIWYPIDLGAINFNSVSLTNINVVITLPIDITININSTSLVSLLSDTEFKIDFTLQETAAFGSGNVDFNLSDGNNLLPAQDITISIQSQSNVIITATVMQPMDMLITMNSLSVVTADVSVIAELTMAIQIASTSKMTTYVLVMPVGWTPSTQYEEIYFTITSSLDINAEITRSIDLNLAV